MARSLSAAALLCAWALSTSARAAGGSDPQAPEDDRWFGPDKALHFGASAGIAAAGYGLSAMVFEDRSARLATGAGLALTLGVAKELNDLAGHGDPSWKDLTWDLIGTATGLAAAYLVDRFIVTPAVQTRGAESASSKQSLTRGVYPAGVGVVVIF